MPGFVAKKICPELVLVPENRPRYIDINHKFMNGLRQYDDCLESVGLDEASLDVTEYCHDNELNTEEQVGDLAKRI